MNRGGRRERGPAPLSRAGAAACGLALVVFVLAGCHGGGREPPLSLPPTPAGGVLARVAGRCTVDQRHLFSPVSPWSPSGSRLALAGLRAAGEPPAEAAGPVTPAGVGGGAAAILDPGSWSFTPLDTPGGTLAAWSPDGRRLAVVEAAPPPPSDGWPEGYSVRLLDALSGATAGVIQLQPPGSAPPFNVVNDVDWYDGGRLIISSHAGTAVDTLWLLDAAGGGLSRLTDITLRFRVSGPAVAFEQWRRGGIRVGAVDASGAVRWFDPEASQLLGDAREGRVLLASWPKAGAAGRTPALVLWGAGEGGWRRRLQDGAGWGSWSRDGKDVAALAVRAEGGEAAAPRVDLVVLDAARGRVGLRVPLGHAPAGMEEQKEQYWSENRRWFEARRPRWSPAEDRLAFLDGAGSLWLLDVETRQATCLWARAAAAAEALGPLVPAPLRLEWSADGRFLAVFLPVRAAGEADYRVELTVVEVPAG
ncbi:MAG: hypothetical protein K6T75_03255 [Acetobacteraceae bacterium]|nr:hypothetical protein [Acetobacteraceae bacterium]